MKIIPEDCRQLVIFRGWELGKIIGSGRFTTVWEAKETDTGHPAVFKWIHVDARDFKEEEGRSFEAFEPLLARELSEARALSRLPEIVGIQDIAYKVSPDRNWVDVFIRMEYLIPLTALLETRGITVGEVADLLRNLARGLAAYHEKGKIYACLKPENILCGDRRYKLADRYMTLLSISENVLLAQRGQFYLCPECKKNQPLSVQCDVYSLGMLLYVLFNEGRIPFQTESTLEDEKNAWARYCDSLDGKIIEKPPKPTQATDGISDVIFRAMAPSPDDRYQTVDELVEAFDNMVFSLSTTERNASLAYYKTREGSFEHHDGDYTGEKNGEAQQDHNDSIFIKSTEEKKKEEPQFEEEKEKIIDSKITEPNADEAGKEEATVSPTKRIRFIIGALGILVLAGIAVLIILFRPPAFKILCEPTETGVVITLSKKPDDPITAELFPEKTGKDSVSAEGKDGVITVDGLVPDTNYRIIVTAGSKKEEATVRTKPAVNDQFEPIDQLLYLFNAYLLDEYSFRDLSNGGLIEKTNVSSIVLRDVSLEEQGLAMYIKFAGKAMIEKIDQPSLIQIVLKTEGGDVYVQNNPIPAYQFDNPVFTAAYDITSLIDRYYNDYGKQISGKAQIEMYWLGEIVGSMDPVFKNAD